MNLQRKRNYTRNLVSDLVDELSEVEENDLHIEGRSSLNIQSVTSCCRNSTNCIVIDRSPLLSDQTSRSSLLTLCLANAQSIKSKSTDLLNYVLSKDLDLFAITETRLREKDTAARLEFIPSETHKFIHVNRVDRLGGGTGLLFKKNIDVKKVDAGMTNSFEFSEWKVEFESLRVRLVIIYRMPYSQAHPVTPKVFFQEFSSYLESMILVPESLVLTGNFNFHVDIPEDPDARMFLDLLLSMGLKQHVSGPTHTSGHTLDLLITREHDSIIPEPPVMDRYLSDHAAILCSLNSSKPVRMVREISYRKLNSIDIDELCDDLIQMELCSKEYADITELASAYNFTLSSLLDKHAPLKKKTVVCRQQVLWFSAGIKAAVQARRKAERKWRRSRSQEHLKAFKTARNHATYLMSEARRNYYSNMIAENSSDQRKLFQITSMLLREPADVTFPRSIPSIDLANNFGNYFVQTIETIGRKLDALTPSREPDVDEAYTQGTLSSFKPLTEEQVAQLISKGAKKSCPLDPMPTSVILQVLDVLLPVLTSMVNMSFESGLFPDEWKTAHVLPVLKKHGLDIAYHNFRPVSNLCYVSKLSERAAVEQLTNHIEENELHMGLQSAYKQHHSVESALLKVRNDILLNMEAQKVTLLVLLDLSAAFDTVKHDILLQRLKSKFGVAGMALHWLTSYLVDRTQRVSVKGALSSSFPLRQGVPQGSCLGPVLFSIYTSKLFDIVKRHLPEVHCYADDTQLYLAFSPNVQGDADAAVSAMRSCITDLRNWMIRDRLMLNDDKTEFLLLGTRQQLAKVDIDSMLVGNSLIAAKPVVRNLGAWFDSTFNMNTHISKVSRAAFYHLHNISRIRRFLSLEDTKALVHAFVTSRVDYTNSLLYGLPVKHLHKLQRVLNAAARLVCCAPSFCHISPLMRELHWLPVKYRIQFKILLFAFKAIHGIAPSYIREMISIKSQGNYNLRSSTGILLAYPTFRTRATLGDRAFVAAAPALWNTLPLELRAMTNVNTFTRHLKTLLFSRAYN